MAKLLIVDDHVVVRDGVKSVFNEQTGTVCFGEASMPQEASKLVYEAEWDIVVLDISLGGRNGLELLKDIKLVTKEKVFPVLSLKNHKGFIRVCEEVLRKFGNIKDIKAKKRKTPNAISILGSKFLFGLLFRRKLIFVCY